MGDRAIVEMRSRDAGGVNLPRGKNGMLYDNRYAWLVKFDVSTGLIIEVSRELPFLMPSFLSRESEMGSVLMRRMQTHTYMDTAMLAKLLDY